MADTQHTIPPGGNVFAALGCEEADNLRIRSDIMIAITKFIQDNDLTQKQAAELLGTQQPRINEIMKGRIDKFSLDKLVTMLTKLGGHLEYSIKLDKVA